MATPDSGGGGDAISTAGASLVSAGSALIVLTALVSFLTGFFFSVSWAWWALGRMPFSSLWSRPLPLDTISAHRLRSLQWCHISSSHLLLGRESYRGTLSSLLSHKRGSSQRVPGLLVLSSLWSPSSISLWFSGARMKDSSFLFSFTKQVVCPMTVAFVCLSRYFSLLPIKRTEYPIGKRSSKVGVCVDCSSREHLAISSSSFLTSSFFTRIVVINNTKRGRLI